MKTRTVLDGNAFYEIDEECMAKRENMQKNMKNSAGQRANVQSEKNGQRDGTMNKGEMKTGVRHR